MAKGDLKLKAEEGARSISHHSIYSDLPTIGVWDHERNLGNSIS